MQELKFGRKGTRETTPFSPVSACIVWVPTKDFRAFKNQPERNQKDCSKINQSAFEPFGLNLLWTFKPNAPMESAARPLSSGYKYLLFLFTLAMCILKRKLPFLTD